MYRSAAPSSRSGGRTSCASQIFSKTVLGTSAPSRGYGDALTSPQARRHDREEAGGPRAGVLEVVRKVGIEGDRIALLELVGLPVADQPEAAVDHERGLAAARLVDRRVVRAGRRRPRRE